ncbi:MAG: type II toxin-antitoxin system death-on-curing family toxin [Alphaproteobacteria bacterium]|nr:type II toxin-antitoxin system death-on-curing family toxin [Alphaproteobacteria bacterium]
MTSYVWVLTDVVLALHEEQLAEHGGAVGVRDLGGLESGLARPQNMAAYDEDIDAAGLAAAYAFRIARNHPFVDGNKRVALVTAELFLALNGYVLTATDSECVIAMVELAEGVMAEDRLVNWFRDNSEPL